MKNTNNSDNKKSFFSDNRKRTFRFGTNAIVLTVAVIVVAILATVLIEKLPLTMDFTTEKLYSISDITKNVLDNIKNNDNVEEIEITVLLDKIKAETNAYSTEYDLSNIVKVLDLYDRYDKINVRYVDPNKNPSIVTDVLGTIEIVEGESASKLSTLVSDCGEGDCIVKCDDKVKIVEVSDMFSTKTDSTYGLSYVNGVQIETVMTAALLHVTQESAPHIYFSTGFGEKDSSKYSVLIFDLEFMGFKVDEVDLASSGIPDDAAMIFFIDPTMDLTANVTDELEEWFSHKTGNAVFLMDPDNTGKDLINFNYIFKLFGLSINNDMVKEANSKSIAGNTFAFKSTTITQGAFSEVPNSDVVIENTRSISIVDDGISRCDAYALVQTTSDAKSILIPSGKESEGQKTVVASGEYYGGTTEAKIFVMGSSENVKDGYEYGNSMSRLLLKAVTWMHDSTLANEATEIDAKLYNSTTVSVTETQSKWIAVISIAVYPALILICGFVIWLKRRHL